MRFVAAAAASLALASVASAQWLPTYQKYEVKRVGLFDAAHTHPVTGEQRSTIYERDSRGRFAGWSYRYGAGQGLDAWYWDGRTTHLIDFGGPDHYNSYGNHWTHAKIVDETGLVAGQAQRFSTTGGPNGYDAWGWKNGVAVQISPDGGPYRGSAGYQFSAIVQTLRPRVPGLIIGTTDRITGVNTRNGTDTWVWDGNVVHMLGFSGPGYTTAAGYQVTQVGVPSANGTIAGTSLRYTPTDVYNGSSAWVWNGTTTVEVGLMTPEYVGSAGYRTNRVGITSSGQIHGIAHRVLGVSTFNGQDAWANIAGVATPIGFADAAHTGSNGYRYSEIVGFNNAGDVVGYTQRTIGVNTNNGNDAWIWRNGVTTQMGLVGPGYTASNGYQWSRPIQIAVNEAGQVKGHSERVLDSGIKNGQDAWAWANGVTTRIGLIGGIYEGSEGYRFSRVLGQGQNGLIFGTSSRIAGVNTYAGEDWWGWNGTTTEFLGLSGAEYIGADGQKANDVAGITDNGQVDGTSTRYLGGSTAKGSDAWVWNGAQTIQIGLVGPDHTSADGTRGSWVVNFGRNAAGVLVGNSGRANAAGTVSGSDMWYFDPTTGITHAVFAGVPGHVRISDGYVSAELRKVSDQGVLFGTYLYFQDGAGDGAQRAFVYRPDLGFANLDALVVGGIAAYGWESLQLAEHLGQFDGFSGYGRTTGQTQTDQRIFALTEIECTADFDDNGISSIDDLFQFFNAWLQDDQRADANGQDGVTIDDLFYFINAWFVGC